MAGRFQRVDLHLHRRGITFAMARVKQDLRDDLQAAGLIDRIGEDLIFPTLPTAATAFRQRHDQPPD